MLGSPLATTMKYITKTNYQVTQSIKTNFPPFFEKNNINDRDINSKRWKPDEAFINELNKTVYIIEKKFQQTSGSVDEKLATFPFKIREYKRLLDPIGYNLVYMYLLSSNWFDTPKYKDYYDYMDELGCHHYFDILPLKAIGLSVS